MISRQVIRGRRLADYYLEFTDVDYYANRFSEPGFWRGGGAKILGLTGPIARKELKNLFEGFDPTGKTALVQNAGKEKRVRALDFAVSVPKSVSVLWAMSEPAVRKKIERIIDEAIEVIVSFLEENAGLTRRGKGGKRIEKAAIIVACFRHITSRAMEPQLHTHLLFQNVVARSDGTFGAMHNCEFFQLRRDADKIFNAVVAMGLRLEFDLKLEEHKESFRIVGVPQEVCDHFSTRHKEITAFMEEFGWSGAIASAVAAVETRPTKVHVPTEQLLAGWHERGTILQWGPKEAKEFVERHANALAFSKRLEEHEICKRLEDDFRKAENKEHVNSFGAEWPRLTQKKGKDGGYVLKHRRWGDILWKKNFGLFEIRIQMREPFSDAWDSNPASKAKIPAIRVVPWRIKLFEPVPPHKRPKPTVHWTQNLYLAELRLQSEQLFKSAPSWSPMKKIVFPRLKIGRKSKEKRSETESENNENGMRQSL